MTCTLCIVPVMPVRMPSRINGLGGGGVSVKDCGGIKHLALANTLARRHGEQRLLQPFIIRKVVNDNNENAIILK